MPENSKIRTNYAGYPIVRVRLLAKKTAWLVVKLEDGKRGMIPKKEWDWSRGKDQKTPSFLDGHSFDAVLLPEESESGIAYLSIKELHNPWEYAEKTLHTGKVVLGEVVNLRNIAAYVEVAPGVTAVLWAKDMPLLADQIPADALSVGDKLHVVITEADYSRKRMQVSVTAWFQRLDAAPSVQKKRLEDVFYPALDKMAQYGTKNAPKASPPITKEYQVRALTRLRKILVIDDTPGDREQISKQMKRAFQVEVIPVESGIAGLEVLDTIPEIDLVVLDIGLDHDEYGPDVAEKIIAKKPQLHIVFTSNDPFRISEIVTLENKTKRTFPFVQKIIPSSAAPPDDSLVEVVQLLFKGLVYRLKNMTKRSEDNFLDLLGASSLANAPLQATLEDMLQTLARANFLEHVVILSLDSKKKEISIVASYPFEQEYSYQKNLDGMYYSQAKNVMEDGEILYADHITKELKTTQFKNFFREVSFRSCYGVPIQSTNNAVRHGLFVLDMHHDFTWETIMRIRTTASLIGVTLERAGMLKILRKYEERYFMGQLFGTFIHELKNNFEALDGYFDTTQFALKNRDVESSLKKLERLESAINDLKTLANSYVRFVNEGMEEVDINQTILKALRQLEHIAKMENHVPILANLDASLPLLYANALHVEQIVLNVVLNAIQHVSAQYRSLTHISESRGYSEPLQLCRAVLVESQFVPETSVCNIIVMDTGPGVPIELRDKIFQEGESTRSEGHGLGLFISKNLTESMQGQLFLLETVRYTGSAFVISFPLQQ